MDYSTCALYCVPFPSKCTIFWIEAQTIIQFLTVMSKGYVWSPRLEGCVFPKLTRKYEIFGFWVTNLKFKKQIILISHLFPVILHIQVLNVCLEIYGLRVFRQFWLCLGSTRENYTGKHFIWLKNSILYFQFKKIWRV